jgi:hypothetical protein
MGLFGVFLRFGRVKRDLGICAHGRWDRPLAARDGGEKLRYVVVGHLAQDRGRLREVAAVQEIPPADLLPDPARARETLL